MGGSDTAERFRRGGARHEENYRGHRRDRRIHDRCTGGGAPATAAPPDGAGAQNSAADGAGRPAIPREGRPRAPALRHRHLDVDGRDGHPETGLVDDNIGGDLDAASASGYTSPTNIGGYLWSTVTARDLGIIGADDARPTAQCDDHHARAHGAKPRQRNVLQLVRAGNGGQAHGLSDLGRHDPSVPLDGRQRLARDGPADRARGGAVTARPCRCALPFDGLLRFLRSGRGRGASGGNQPRGILGGASRRRLRGGSAMYNGSGETVSYTCHHYDTTVSESRIATYLAISDGTIPATGLYGTHRTMPAGCDWAWQEQLPTGTTRQYDGVDVYEGVYSYDGMSFVTSWRRQHVRVAHARPVHPGGAVGSSLVGSEPPHHRGSAEGARPEGREVRLLGLLARQRSFGGYSEYGVDLAGMRSDGYTSDREKTDVDIDRPGCHTGHKPLADLRRRRRHAARVLLALPYDHKGVMDISARSSGSSAPTGPVASTMRSPSRATPSRSGISRSISR